MFYIDLENEQIIDKAGNANMNKENQDEENKNFEDEEISGTNHPVLLNQYPICINHSLFLLFA